MLINRAIMIILPLTILLLNYGSINSVNIFAAPPDPKFSSSKTCTESENWDKTKYKKSCCWNQRIPGKLPPSNTANYCQSCTYDRTTGVEECSNPKQQLTPTIGDNPQGEDVLEQPFIQSNKGTIIDKNLAQDQPMQFSSNDEQSEGSKELTETNIVDTESNAQENDDSSTSEKTASFAQKGNTQNSPVPPECPKQGPIPPDCTMKPKF